LRIVLVVDVVANTNEFTAIVSAGQQDHRDAQNVRLGDAGNIGCIGLENELVDANRNGADQEGVEFLIVLVTVIELEKGGVV
jgi:hypothetical protein